MAAGIKYTVLAKKVLATTIAKVPFCRPTSINQHLKVSLDALKDLERK